MLEAAHHLTHRRPADLEAVGDARLDDVDVVLLQLEDALAVLLERRMVLSRYGHGRHCTGAVRGARLANAGGHTADVQIAAPLRARAVTVTRGPLVVLESVDLSVADGDTIGLVGPNGVGKSTLLRVLAGELQPDRGRVERTPPTATVGYLPQVRRSDDDETIRDHLHRRTGVSSATDELHAAADALAATGEPGRDEQRSVRRRPGALAGRRCRRSRRSRRRGVGRPRLGSRPARSVDGDAVRWRSGPRRARRPAVVPLRRVPARRTDERPGPRRARSAGTLDHRAGGGRR